jgi:hypothetical protein
MAVSKCNIILSLLGPNKLRLSSNTKFPDYYRLLFPLMRQYGATRIYAMGTFSIYEPLDHFSLIRTLFVWLVYLVAHMAYRNVIGIGQVFEKKAEGIEWTVFRIGGIPGGCDAESWRRERGGEVAVGWVGERGWRSVIRRSELARWLVDCAEGKEGEAWVTKKPAVSSRGSQDLGPWRAGCLELRFVLSLWRGIFVASLQWEGRPWCRGTHPRSQRREARERVLLQRIEIEQLIISYQSPGLGAWRMAARKAKRVEVEVVQMLRLGTRRGAHHPDTGRSKGGQRCPISV